mmetsp:Transcript_37298/g.95339  ORF Transcript_37298/g.95339 Transcript_37298/m.95339 type:complete len:271 (-) Transcript_37298:512-1324(-)
MRPPVVVAKDVDVGHGAAQELRDGGVRDPEAVAGVPQAARKEHVGGGDEPLAAHVADGSVGVARGLDEVVQVLAVHGQALHALEHRVLLPAERGVGAVVAVRGDGDGGHLGEDGHLVANVVQAHGALHHNDSRRSLSLLEVRQRTADLAHRVLIRRAVVHRKLYLLGHREADARLLHVRQKVAHGLLVRAPAEPRRDLLGPGRHRAHNLHNRPLRRGQQEAEHRAPTADVGAVVQRDVAQRAQPLGAAIQQVGALARGLHGQLRHGELAR